VLITYNSSKEALEQENKQRSFTYGCLLLIIYTCKEVFEQENKQGRKKKATMQKIKIKI
jgi:hypothetical protein